MDIIRKAKLWARLTPPKGRLPDGNLEDALGADYAIVVFDQHGRVFQIEEAEIRHCALKPIRNGRTATLELLDKLDVQDWPELPDEMAG